MLKIGWKASAEQFEPRPLVEYAVLAEELGYDSVVVSDHFHPWRHDGGHSPVLVRLAGRRGRAHVADRPGHERRRPGVPLPPGDRGPGHGHPRRALPEAGVPRRGHRRGPERDPARRGVARAEGALPDAQGGVRPDPAAVARGSRDLRGRVLQDRRATIYDKPEGRSRSTSPPRARPRRGWPAASPTASSPPAARTRRSTPRSCCPRCARASRRRAARPARWS